jgi:hypothetical protein
MKKIKRSGKEKLYLETESEKEILEKARSYFGDANTLLNEGLGMNKSKNSSAAYFRALASGFGSRYATCISAEHWNEIKRYAKLFDEGKRYSGVIILPEV